jgi:hypothetical protein
MPGNIKTDPWSAVLIEPVTRLNTTPDSPGLMTAHPVKHGIKSNANSNFFISLSIIEFLSKLSQELPKVQQL